MPTDCARISAMASVRVRKPLSSARFPSLMSSFILSASHRIFGATYVRNPSCICTSLPPISRHAVSSICPFSKKQMLLVPPPMSRFATILPVSFESCAAPEPFPARTDSRSAPAVATTKSPAIPEIAFTTSSAFFFLEDSPVIITAPVLRSEALIPAFLYSPSIIS